MKLSDIVNNINGHLKSDGEFETLEFCTTELDVKFLSFIEKEKFIKSINMNISCIICTEEIVEHLPEWIEGVFITENPKETFFEIHNSLCTNENYKKKDFDSKIGESCIISDQAYVASKNVVIGNNVIIEPFVVINENTTIGDNCIIHSGTTIGGKSFTFAKTKSGGMIGMKDLGQVILDSDVEICSNCHVSKGILPTDITYIGKNVKLDAMVHVAHGVKIGERTLLPAGVQIAGNVNIGKDVWIGVNATIANRLEISDNARVSLGAVVTKDVAQGETVSGNFAIPHKKFLEFVKEISK